MSRDTLAGAALVGIAVVYWWAAGGIAQSVLSGQVGADALPRLLAWMLGGLGLLLMAEGLLRHWRESGLGAAALEVARPGQWRAHLRALGMLAIAAGYIILVPYLGYVISIALLLAAVALYSGAPNRGRVLVLAGLGAVIFYVLFVHVLQVPQPAGLWPELIG